MASPADVLRLDEVAVPDPRAGQIRVRVHACGLNPADWALCRGLFAGNLPRGIGLDVSGTVEAIGDGVSDVRIGQSVLGVPDFQAFRAPARRMRRSWPSGRPSRRALILSMRPRCRWRSKPPAGASTSWGGGRAHAFCLRRRNDDRLRRCADGAHARNAGDCSRRPNVCRTAPRARRRGHALWGWDGGSGARDDRAARRT